MIENIIREFEPIVTGFCKKGETLICTEPYYTLPSLIKNKPYTAFSDSYINHYGVEVVRVIDEFVNEKEYHVKRFEKQKR